MPSFNAFNKLDAITRVAINDRVLLRMKRFLALKTGAWTPKNEILLVGDRPAPSAPVDPAFHYTPFGAHWNSSLWLNALLEKHQIPEERLGWVNAYDLDGTPTNQAVLKHQWGQIIARGGNASQWCKQHVHIKVQHPQAWKRFHSKEPYPLIGYLGLAT